MAKKSSNLSLKAIRLPIRRERRPRVPTHVTSIDLDGAVLRVAQTSQRGGVPALTRVAVAPLEFPAEADRSSPAVVGAAIRRAFAHLKLSPGSVVMGVPRAQVVLRTLQVPVIHDLRELASVVHLQISRDLPFRMEEAVVDFKVRPASDATPAPAVDAAVRPEGVAEAPAPRLEVLVAAVKREVVEFYLQAAEASGVKLMALGLLPYANARCVEACQVADGDTAFAVVTLRPDEVGIDVVAEQALRFSRGATIRPAVAEGAGGAADSPRPENFADAATLEVVRSLHSYGGMEPNRPTAHILVAGATGFEAAVVESLGRRLGTPCVQLDPAKSLELRPESQEAAAGAISAIGLALGAAETRGLPFDFLNPKQPKVHRDLRRIRLLSAVAAAVVVFVGVAGLRARLIQDRNRRHEQATTELAAAEKNSPIYRRMLSQVASVEDWVKSDRDWLAHYAYLTAILPSSEDVYVTSLTIANQGTLRLAVQAQSGEILAKLDQQLRAAGYDVKPLAITPGADRFGYEFRSNVELVPTSRLKIDLARAKPPGRPSDDGSLDPSLYRKGGG